MKNNERMGEETGRGRTGEERETQRDTTPGLGLTCGLARPPPPAGPHHIKRLASVYELHQLIHHLRVALVVGHVVQRPLPCVPLGSLRLLPLGPLLRLLVPPSLVLLLYDFFLCFLFPKNYCCCFGVVIRSYLALSSDFSLSFSLTSRTHPLCGKCG